MKILVTGANGFLGQNVIEHLKSTTAHEILAIGREECDLLDSAQCKNAIKDVDCVVHIATKLQLRGSDPYSILQENTLMNLNVLDAVRVNKIPHLISMGTYLMYPEGTTLPAKEKDLGLRSTQPKKEYITSKFILLVGMEDLHTTQGTHCTFLILPNLFGKHDHFSSNTAHFIPEATRRLFEAVKEGEETIEFFGPGEGMREFAYASDVAFAIEQALDLNGFNILNVPGTHITVKEFSQRLAKKIGFEGDLRFPQGEVPDLFLDASEIKARLPAYEITPIDKAIEDMLSWFKENHS